MTSENNYHHVNNQIMLTKKLQDEEIISKELIGTTVTNVCSIEDGHFSWKNSQDDNIYPILKKINLTIPQGKMTIITGPTGVGKSSLVLGLIGEVPLIQGKIEWNSYADSISYVPQTPWLMNVSLRDNILFGLPFEKRRYDKVLIACSLQKDCEILPAKDMTEIGERGINLSGGQKQRIALARAIYSPSRTVILDDPLSALDPHVASGVFEKGINELLLKRKRTVILVTHKVEYFEKSAKIIVLDQLGHIRHQGKLDEIKSKDPKLYEQWINSMKIEQEKSNKCDPEICETVKARNKLQRMFSKQAVSRSLSNHEQKKSNVAQRMRHFSFQRQISHDPSAPLPFHDCTDECDEQVCRRQPKKRLSHRNRNASGWSLSFSFNFAYKFFLMMLNSIL